MRRETMIRWRKAKEADMNELFSMGYDEWGEGNSLEEHINECRQSKKYEKGQWYVLEDTENERVVSSLIAYDLHSRGEPAVKGLGSIATAPEARKKGYGSMLIKETIKGLGEEGCHHFFLFSDIDVTFYMRLGFHELPEKYQRYKNTICMLYQGNDEFDLEHFAVPDYF